MTKQYHILAGSSQKGPYDLVMLIRKIRNGSLTDDALVTEEGEKDPRRAKEWPELAEYFIEKKEVRNLTGDKERSDVFSLSRAFQGGWQFLQQNLVACIFSGFSVLLCLLMLSGVYAVLPPPINTMGYMACFVFFQLLFSCYMLLVLRMIRGQPADFDYFSSKFFPAIKSLLLLGLIVSIPSLIGLFLLTNRQILSNYEDNEWLISLAGLLILVIPGLYVLSLHVFAPLLILDQGYTVWEAIQMSRKAILRYGIGESSIIYTIYLALFFGAMMAMLPLALLMPITTSALCEFYEECFA
jgi:hypothetical protein